MDAAHLDRQRPRRGPRPGASPRRPRPPAGRRPEARLLRFPASVIPPASASTASRRIAATAARRRRFRRRTVSRRARKRSFGSSDGYNMDTGSSSVGQSAGGPARDARSTIRVDGALRPRHPAARRGRPDRHRTVRPGAHAAVEPRRARRPAVPRVPELALPVHRRQGRAGGADRARRGRGTRSRSSSTPASSSSARRSSG